MILYRLPVACIFTYVIAISFRRSWRQEEGVDWDKDYEGYGETYVYLNPLGLVFVFLVCFAAGWLLQGTKEGWYKYSLSFLDVLVNMAVFYILLIIIVPFLRKYISAKACAILWLLPMFLLYQPRIMFDSAYVPLFHLYVPDKILKIIMAVWVLGFVVVFLWKFIGHLYFRHLMLEKSEKIDDENILKIWKEELEKGNYKREVDIYFSENAKTPLSIGVSNPTRVVVLPYKIYTDEELHFIFRHEITHLKRLDIETKFLLTLYNAMCWFNPLTWIAVRKANEDLELSCDELVLKECDASERKQYANLLLKTAGDERGFTTCLSVNAKSLRYRLKNVVNKRTLHRGTAVLAIIFFCFYMSYGVVAVTTDCNTVKEVLCMEEKDLTIESVYYESRRNDLGLSTVLFYDEERLIAYFSDLVVEKYVGVSEMTEDEIISIYAGTAIGHVDIKFSANLMAITTYHEEYETEYYRLKSEIDREYILSCLEFDTN